VLEKPGHPGGDRRGFAFAFRPGMRK